ncbi:TrmH family RNA methyltransferase [Aestuariimicrobium ganziense]|uniref:TrmH family RNA methyltransferase n=1 Tax=Aestuariimicrobium ganziense TaxID=2773677 RepID=UPI00194590FE|nr:RNA methyltransferase [Aestuariimicrobium ganziense]
MARYLEVDDPHDPRLADYVRLRETTLRQSIEAEHGLYIAEGEKVIRRALEAGHQPRSLMLAPRWIEGLRDLLDGLDVDVWVVSPALAEQVTGFHVHRGALASMRRPEVTPLDDLFGSRRLVLCEDLVDHANVGAIIRCAAGLGWDAVALSPRSADPLYRRAVKTSMGTVFSLPWTRLGETVDDLRRLRDAGFCLVAAALTCDAVTLDALPADLALRPLALLLGTEGDGLSDAWLDEADVVVSIPMARGVDSLNVATAAAVLCWELRDRR